MRSGHFKHHIPDTFPVAQEKRVHLGSIVSSNPQVRVYLTIPHEAAVLTELPIHDAELTR